MFNELNLSGVNFSDCDLRDSVFSDCRLDHAQFARANLKQTAFNQCAMSGGPLLREPYRIDDVQRLPA